MSPCPSMRYLMARKDLLNIICDGNKVPIFATENEWMNLVTLDNIISHDDTLNFALQRKQLKKPAGILKSQIMMRSYKIELTKRLLLSGIQQVMRRDVESTLRRFNFNIEEACCDLLFNTLSSRKQLADSMVTLRVDIKQLQLEVKSRRRMMLHSTPKGVENQTMEKLALALDTKMMEYRKLREKMARLRKNQEEG